MNIFWLDEDLEKAAIAHCDKHVVKMILEYSQLLSSAIHSINSSQGPLFSTSGIYRPTHMNHPCAVWARAGSKNYNTLLELLGYLLQEYTHRYWGRIHKCTAIYHTLHDFKYEVYRYLPPIATTKPQVMLDEFKGLDAVESYRHYYRYKYGIISMRWTFRNIPDWL